MFAIPAGTTFQPSATSQPDPGPAASTMKGNPRLARLCWKLAATKAVTARNTGMCLRKYATPRRRRHDNVGVRTVPDGGGPAGCSYGIPGRPPQPGGPTNTRIVCGPARQVEHETARERRLG